VKALVDRREDDTSNDSQYGFCNDDGNIC